MNPIKLHTRIFQIISEEPETKGIILFEGVLSACYWYRKNYLGKTYPSLSIKKDG